MMLEWMGRRHGSAALGRAAAAIEAAVDSALSNPQTRTADLKGPLGTRAFTQVVVDKLG
jgi:3-isopropylmalate dehydrogenase